MSSDPEEKKLDDHQKTSPTNDDDDDCDDENHSYVSEPDEAQKRYAALRNHQIRFSDAIDPNAERVYKVNDVDIVLGRGRGFQNHKGNQRMRNLIENFKNRYHSLNRMEKRKMVREVYDKISEGGARFLKKLDKEEAWVVVDLPIALQKVSHTLRCRKSIHKWLDADGHVPRGVGGPTPALDSKTCVPISRSPVIGADPLGAAFLGGIPRIVSAGTRDSMGALSFAASAPRPMTVGPLTGFVGGYPMCSITDLEAQQLAAHSRYHVLAGMSPDAQMEYIAEMQRQQIILETQMYTRMGDALLMTSATPGMVAASLGGKAAGLLPSMHAILPSADGGKPETPEYAGTPAGKQPTMAEESSSLQPSSTKSALQKL